MTEMNAKDDRKKKMLYQAYRCLFFNEMLINQCDNWLPAEEGDKNLILEMGKNLKIKNY